MVVLIALPVIGCSPVGDSEVTTPENADALYVVLTADRRESTDLVPLISEALPGEESSAVGFIPGVRSDSVVTDGDDVFGVRVEFHSDIPDASRDRLESRVNDLGLMVTWLRSGDEWPNCMGEADCRLVN